MTRFAQRELQSPTTRERVVRRVEPAGNVTDHPHYAEEKQRLADTLERIDQLLERPVSEAGADAAANRAIRDQQLRSTGDLRTARAEPYFARLDWLADGRVEQETFYVGKVGFRSPNLKVYSWAAPMIQAIYLLQSPESESGRVMLKRTFEIADATLQAIHDQYVDPSLADTLVAEQFTDSLLLKLLRENRRGQLHDIVATIQAQQYRIIQSSPQRLLVVQGAPGSGKTSLALHRVAYLLYNHPSLKRVLVLGPNPMFMRYVAHILPALGERDIPQRTFDDWILQMLDAPVEVEPQDSSLETLLDTGIPTADRVMHFRNARNKGSLLMATLLDRYVALMEELILADKPALRCTINTNVRYDRRPGAVFDFAATEERDPGAVRAVVAQTRAAPWNARREQVERLLLRDLGGALWRKVNEAAREYAGDRALGDEEAHDLRRQIAETAQRAIHAYFEGWDAENVSVAYRRLFRNRSLLRQVGAGVFSREDLELLALDAPSPRRPFRFSDLAALLYFKLRLDGAGDTAYDHIVVDEAQDLTPLHFRALQEYCSGGAMTVLGDLSQSIYAHQGIGSWGELGTALADREVVVETIRESYRSTEPIVRYTNALLTRTGSPAESLAQWVARPGEEPHMQGFNSPADLAGAIATRARSERRQSRQSVAIICKTLARCRALDQDLTAAGFTDYQFIETRDTDYKGETALLPSYLTKGLEFDSVIIADADDETYSPDDLNRRLLYVALTRAAHALHIFWLGRRARMLDPIPTVRTPGFLPAALRPRALTLAEYAATQPGSDSDAYVERLARAGKLDLLRAATLDASLLEILLRAPGGDGEDLAAAEPLDEETAAAVRQLVTALVSSNDPRAQRELAWMELAGGLLRHALAGAGLGVGPQEKSAPAELLVRLATLDVAVGRGRVALVAGRGSSRKQALSLVTPARLSSAEQQLQALLAYGLVELTRSASGVRVRVRQEWLPGLLAASVGRDPTDWDPDLRSALGLPAAGLALPVGLGRG